MNIGKQNDKLSENHKERWQLLTRFIVIKINKTKLIFVT